MLGKDESSVFVSESGYSAGVLSYVPEVRIIQPQ